MEKLSKNQRKYLKRVEQNKRRTAGKVQRQVAENEQWKEDRVKGEAIDKKDITKVKPFDKGGHLISKKDTNRF